MTDSVPSIIDLLQEDPRYKLDAYSFIREALGYAHHQLEMGEPEEIADESGEQERHLTGQQLCEAIRQYALEQFGLLTLNVLESWGVNTTGDFGEIVYNMIRIGLMKQSDHDRREDFNDVYEFQEVFKNEFEINLPD
jgi:uncharacterized repeat protein (TIGR04138 family)